MGTRLRASNASSLWLVKALSNAALLASTTLAWSGSYMHNNFFHSVRFLRERSEMLLSEVMAPSYSSCLAEAE